MATKKFSTSELRQFFKATVAEAGMPIDRAVKQGGAAQLYKFTKGPHRGKKLRLRTNNNYMVMDSATGTDADNSIPDFEDVDFIGIACVNPDNEQIECYLVPAPRVVQDMKEGHRRSSERLGRESNSDVRCLYFSDERERPWHGYAEKYREFLLPPIPAAMPSKEAQAAPPASITLDFDEASEIFFLAQQVNVECNGDPKVRICSARIMKIIEAQTGKLVDDEGRVIR